MVGDELPFSLDYGARVTAMTAEYVNERACHGGALTREPGECRA
jgi:hypothetical protein